MDYLDFEVEISPADGGAYSVRVLTSPAGEATETMRLPFDSLALQNRLLALQVALLRGSGTRRRIDQPEVKTVQQFGAELWGALFAGEINSLFEGSRNKAREQNSGLRLKLRFTSPELAVLPWEYLYDADRGDYLSLSLATPLVRYIPLPQPMEPLTVQPPLRVLGLVVSPDDLAPLDVQREKQRLESALARLRDRGLIELEWLPGRTWRDLQQALRRGPWHVFHFIGHGGFDEVHGEGVIVLADDEGRSHSLSATDLGRFLGDHEPLRLAVLNSCESARGDQADVFSSTAAVLVRRGTPAVVAMQYEITDDAAIEFSRSFYEAIADGLPVDTAVSEARKGIATAVADTLEWGTPVLFMRAPDGVLFRIPATARPAAGDERAPQPREGAEGRPATDRASPEDAPVAAPMELAKPTPPVVAPGADAAPPRAVAVPGATSEDRAGSRRATLVGLAAVAIVALFSVGIVASVAMRPARDRTLDMALSADRAHPGDTVTIRGSGFTAGETVDILIAGVVRTRTTAKPDGGFEVELTIPSDAGESSTIEALGLTSGRRIDRPFSVVATPSPATSPSASPRPPPAITVSAEEAQPGDHLTVSGTGFDPGEPVQLSIGGILLDLASAGRDGSFSGDVLLPNELAPVGSDAQVMLAAAEGRNSKLAASRAITIRGAPEVKPSIDFRLFSLRILVFDVCASGYVWREAFEGDHACVTLDRRDQALQDNAAADSRVDPSGSFGPDTCVKGYVWREARPEDHVCVTQEERERVAADNRDSPSRH